MHSYELTLTAEDDAFFRANWDALAAAGLNSRANALSRSNAPHITVSSSLHLDGSADELAHAAFAATLPIEFTVAGLVLFGNNPFVVAHALQCEPSAHARVAEFVEQAGALFEPIRTTWVPHLMLARRIRAGRMHEALAAIDPAAGRTVRAIGMRRWDPQARYLHVIAGEVIGPTGHIPDLPAQVQ